MHITAKPMYEFIPKDWEERTVPLGKEVVELLRKHPRNDGCPLVFPSVSGKPSYRFLHDRCKAIAKRAGRNPKNGIFIVFATPLQLVGFAVESMSERFRFGLGTSLWTRLRNT